MESQSIFLGIEIARSNEGILLCHRKNALDLIEEHGLLGAKLTSTPIYYNHKITSAEDSDLLENSSMNRQLVGKLMYLTFNGLDIVYAIQILSQFMERPRNVHLQATYRVLKYLKRTLGQGILLSSALNMQLKVYCDSDWVGCPMRRKSITWFVIFLGNYLMSWKS